MKKFLFVLLTLVLASFGCTSRQPGVAGSRLSKNEKELISNSDSVMHVLTTDVHEDSVFLRQKSEDFSDRDLRSKTFGILSAKLVATVKDPSQDGVGIAGPQVGLHRRIIAVQRLDKPDKPFEVYADVKLDSLFGNVVRGQEGCLSVPWVRGIVPRYSKVIVSWKDPSSLEYVRDTVEGFTAIIFQHEIDHLEGILYTDKADSVFTYGKK